MAAKFVALQTQITGKENVILANNKLITGFYKNISQTLNNPKCFGFLRLLFYALSCDLLERQTGISRDTYAKPRIPIIYQSCNDYMLGKPWFSDYR